VPVPPADQVRRRTIGSVDPDDLAVAVLVALVNAPDRQLVSDLCSHLVTSLFLVVSLEGGHESR
jgi:hypothetical protein